MLQHSGEIRKCECGENRKKYADGARSNPKRHEQARIKRAIFMLKNRQSATKSRTGEGSTTIPRGSRSASVWPSEVVAPIFMGDDIVYAIKKFMEQFCELRTKRSITRYIAGRQDTGGTWSITVNLTDDTIAEWTALISASQTAEDSGLSTWFEVYSPYHDKAFYVVAQPPKEIPLPELAQNELETVDMTLTINEYKGMDTAIKPVASAA